MQYNVNCSDLETLHANWQQNDNIINVYDNEGSIINFTKNNNTISLNLAAFIDLGNENYLDATLIFTKQ